MRRWSKHRADGRRDPPAKTPYTKGPGKPRPGQIVLLGDPNRRTARSEPERSGIHLFCYMLVKATS
jgi:hypothetical protein